VFYESMEEVPGLLSLKNQILSIFRKNGLAASWKPFRDVYDYDDYDENQILVPKIRVSLAPPDGYEDTYGDYFSWQRYYK